MSNSLIDGETSPCRTGDIVRLLSDDNDSHRQHIREPVGVGALVLDGVDKANGSAYAYPETITVSFVNGDEPQGIPSDASTGSINGTPAQAAATPATNTASNLTR